MVDELLKLAAKKVLAQEPVDDLEASRRMAICNACPSLIIEGLRCGECGCYLEIKTRCKTNRSFARPNGEITHCPLGKWGDIEIANYYRAQEGKELL